MCHAARIFYRGTCEVEVLQTRKFQGACLPDESGGADTDVKAICHYLPLRQSFCYPQAMQAISPSYFRRPFGVLRGRHTLTNWPNARVMN